MTWNIGTLIDKFMELVDTEKRGANLPCLQKAKWKGNKAKEIGGYNCWYTEEEDNSIGVGIIVKIK